MNRRQFIGTGLATGTGLILASNIPSVAQTTPTRSEEINVALIGAGAQGRALLNAATAIPKVRFVAVGDIWEYSRRTARIFLESFGHAVHDYEDYRELLEKEKDLHAVIIATPDFAHAEQTNACLQAGLHVYCETMMAHSLAAARSMVSTMKTTGKLLQIGYQRRSNPRYQHVRDPLLAQAKLPGRMTQVNAQWQQPAREDLGWPRKFTLTDDLLRQYGYASMHEFRNWSWYRTYGAGTFARYGAHQVDVMNWLLAASPKSVLADGGGDFYPEHQWPDNVTALLSYETAAGVVRGLCQVLTTTNGSGENSFEHFLGTEGSIRIAENAKWTRIFREPHAPDWGQWIRLKYLSTRDAAAGRPLTSEEVHVRETGGVVPYELPIYLTQSPLQPHLENFFDALRGQAKLNCPAPEALLTEVVVHKVNEALAMKKMLVLSNDNL